MFIHVKPTSLSCLSSPKACVLFWVVRVDVVRGRRVARCGSCSPTLPCTYVCITVEDCWRLPEYSNRSEAPFVSRGRGGRGVGGTTDTYLTVPAWSDATPAPAQSKATPALDRSPVFRTTVSPIGPAAAAGQMEPPGLAQTFAQTHGTRAGQSLACRRSLRGPTCRQSLLFVGLVLRCTCDARSSPPPFLPLPGGEQVWAMLPVTAACRKWPQTCTEVSTGIVSSFILTVGCKNRCCGPQLGNPAR